MTKSILAQNIIMALYNLPYLPPVTSPSVALKVQRNSKATLEKQFVMATKALHSVGRLPVTQFC